LTQSWGSHPSFKVETSGETFINEASLSMQISRMENNVSYVVLQVTDYKSKNFEAVFDALNALDVSLRYGSDSWTKVFSGTISTVSPTLKLPQGEVLEVSCWGKGNALAKTHCDTSYGLESQNPTLETPKEIWDDLVDNYINKSFGGDATGYAITKTKIADIRNGLDILNITSPYQDCFTILNRVCDVVTAYVGGLGVASCHWFVDPDANLFINTIGDHENDASGWPTYWNSSQADSTIEVSQDMILYDFRKNVEEYANKIVLCSALRKPGYDYFTENQSALWDTTACTLTDDAATKIVGTHSLKMEPSNLIDDMLAWYPSGKDAAWDFTKCGSVQTIPQVSFYARRDQDLGSTSGIRMATDDANYFFIIPLTNYITAQDEWIAMNFPIGPYWNLETNEGRRFRWAESGSPDWSDIDYIMFRKPSQSQTGTLWIDDLHFTGKIIREAYDSTAITNNDEYQKVIRNDIAVNDTIKASDDSGTAARLAYAELLRRMRRPTVAIIQTPLAIDILPGQLVHTHACKKSDNTFRIDKDLRIKEIQHIIRPEPEGFSTTLNLTDDVYSTHAFGAPTRASILAKYAGALGHGQARDLKGSGIDILIPRLSKNYA